jgi:hypothetical protein
VPDDVRPRLETRSRETGLSINQPVLDILSAALGVEAADKRLRREDATWTPEVLAEFEAALRDQRRIDECIWD